MLLADPFVQSNLLEAYISLVHVHVSDNKKKISNMKLKYNADLTHNKLTCYASVHNGHIFQIYFEPVYSEVQSTSGICIFYYCIWYSVKPHNLQRKY